jgi:plasmid maintenance system antidote protein VapI
MPRIRTHPGEVLREEFMMPLGLSANRLAAQIDVPANRMPIRRAIDTDPRSKKAESGEH